VFDTTPIQPDPQWVVPVPLLSDDKLMSLFYACAEKEIYGDTDAYWRVHAKGFAHSYPEFGKDWKWYYERAK
jgi:hypothetical protein